MKDSKEIIDTEIKEWVESYDYKVDSDTCADVAEQIALDVANSLILSVVKKVGVIEGINKANEILKSKLDINTEIEINPLIKEINNLSELELKIIALKTCNLSSDTKKKLLDRYIQETNILEKKSPSVTDLLKEQINKVYQNLGELPSNNINEVKLVKDQKKPIATRPFGRKKSK